MSKSGWKNKNRTKEDFDRGHPVAEIIRATTPADVKMDPEAFCTDITAGRAEACGAGAIMTGIFLARERAWESRRFSTISIPGRCQETEEGSLDMSLL